MQSEHIGTHRQDKQRHRKYRRHPPAAREIDQFGVGSIVQRRRFGFERHAADRATARTIAPDFRVHWTGPDRADRCRQHLLRRFRQIPVGVGSKLCRTAGAAEEVPGPVMFGMMLRASGIDGHATYRVLDLRCGYDVGIVHFGHGRSFDCRTASPLCIKHWRGATVYWSADGQRRGQCAEPGD